MTANELASTAKALVADGRGILAADESVATISKRFANLGIESTPDTRRAYRETLLTTPGISQFISGAILYDETIRQSTKEGKPFPQALEEGGIIPGIKVDTGAKDLAKTQGEKITEGLDGLKERVAEYYQLGARFAKWRAVITIGDKIPSYACINANANALARYAAICQEGGLVPIVEPEVLMEGSHSFERCLEITSRTLNIVFEQLRAQNVSLEHMLLKPSMIVAGKDASKQASVSEVANATVTCYLRNVPAAVAGIVLLSGGQADQLATKHLNAMNAGANLPWKLTYSYGRALQDSALSTWAGSDANIDKAQKALYLRAKCNTAAAKGVYSKEMENS